MNWVFLALASALALGIYDVAKKASLKRNGVLEVLLASTVLSIILMLPFFRGAEPKAFLLVFVKSVLVTASWVSGLAAMKELPLTTLSTIKASRPVFVLLFSILLFGERLGPLQWCGVTVVFAALLLLSRASSSEGIDFTRSRGVLYAFITVFSGVASGLFDKHIIAGEHLHPLFVQCWTNVFIALLLILCLLFAQLRRKKIGQANPQPFRWDWMLLVIAVLITVADALYFFALNGEGALLSVISMIRRGAAIVTFVLSALIFKEKKLRTKGLALALMFAGIALLVLGS